VLPRRGTVFAGYPSICAETIQRNAVLSTQMRITFSKSSSAGFLPDIACFEPMTVPDIH
jgi:hypothetical protein